MIKDLDSVRYARYFAAAFLFLLSFVQYVNALPNDFVWDAEGAFREDASIRDPANIPSFFARGYTLVPSGTSQPEGASRGSIIYYRPAVRSLHAIEFQFFGTTPYGYNLVNVLLNGCVVVMAFLLVEAVTGSVGVSTVASVLYAVNPSRAEAVYWAYSDAVILSALFSLISLYFHRKDRRLAFAAFLVLALLSHEAAVVLPVVVFLHDYTLPSTGRSRSLSGTAIALIAAGAYLVLRRTAAGPVPFTDLDIFQLCNAAAVIVKKYTRLFFIPDAPITIYEFRRGAFSGLSPEVALSYAVVAAHVVAGFLLWRFKREYLFWFLWFFALISFSFNVGRLGDYLLAEKNIYLASLGFCVVLSSLVFQAVRARLMLSLAIVFLVVYHFATTYLRGHYWKDTTTYLEEAVKFAPDFYLAHLNLGSKYVVSGNYDKAVAYYQRAMKARPELRQLCEELIGDAYFRKGNDAASRNDFDSALTAYWSALLHAKRGSSAVFNNIGNIHFVQGDIDKAAAQWLKALEADPNNPEVYNNLALAYERLGDHALAQKYRLAYRERLSGPEGKRN